MGGGSGRYESLGCGSLGVWEFVYLGDVRMYCVYCEWGESAGVLSIVGGGGMCACFVGVLWVFYGCDYRCGVRGWVGVGVRGRGGEGYVPVLWVMVWVWALVWV